jgi:hypothetical protein
MSRGGHEGYYEDDQEPAEAVSSLSELVAHVALVGAALLLLVTCWRYRAALGALCAGLGLALAIAPPFGPIGTPTATLLGSFLATAIGTVLLILGQFVQRLLDAEPDQRAERDWKTTGRDTP